MGDMSRPAAAIPVGDGRLGTWLFLASEVTTFGGLFGIFALARHAAGGWAEPAAHLQFGLALVNTLLLLAGSLTMARAHAAACGGAPRTAAGLLAAATLLGLGFLAIKGVEYGRELAAGFAPGAGPFWGFYFGLTGLHALHVAAGVVLVGALAARVWRSGLRAEVSARIGAAALYWHFVDAVWLTLVALLYLGSASGAAAVVVTGLVAAAAMAARAGLPRPARWLAAGLAVAPLALVAVLLLVLAPDLAVPR